MRIIKFKNNKVSADSWIGVQIEAGAYYQLQNQQDLDLAIASTKVNQDIWSGDLIINDGNADLSSAIGDSWLKNPESLVKDVMIISQPAINISSAPSFGSKTFIHNGIVKKLFARFTGIQQALNIGSNVISYTVAVPWGKIIGIEVINSEALDTATFRVYDDNLGTYSTIPNYMLNQFSDNLNISKDYYIKTSQFDADLYVGMVLEITYTSISAKTVGINFLINEITS